jgi:hypothetical protein
MLCDQPFDGNIPGMLVSIKRLPGASVAQSQSPDFDVINVAPGQLWNFTKASHPAHPSVACRRIIQVDDSFQIETRIECQASKTQCDKLRNDYAALDKRMIDSLNPVKDAASGLAVKPPPGYVAHVASGAAAQEVVITVTKPNEAGTVCRVSFRPLPFPPGTTQEVLNTAPGNYKESLGAFYDVLAVERFEHAGVRGTAILGISKKNPKQPNWAPDLPARIYSFYTPKGHTSVTCWADKTLFDARRPVFEAVARALTLPR